MVSAFRLNLTQTDASDANSRVSTCHNAKREEIQGDVRKEFEDARSAYRQFSEADIPCKHISEELFFSEKHTLHKRWPRKTSAGRAPSKSIHWFPGKQDIVEENLKQLDGIKDASGLAKWLIAFLASIQSCGKASTSLRSDKWGAKTQLQNGGNAINSLILAKKAFCTRPNALNPEVITGTQFDSSQREINALGRDTPVWAQRLAQDTLIKYAHAELLFSRLINDLASTNPNS